MQCVCLAGFGAVRHTVSQFPPCWAQEHQPWLAESPPASPEVRVLLRVLAWGVPRGHTTVSDVTAVPCVPAWSIPASLGTEELEPCQGAARDAEWHPDGCRHLQFSQIKREWSQNSCYIPVSLPYNLSFESAAYSFI